MFTLLNYKNNNSFKYSIIPPNPRFTVDSLLLPSHIKKDPNILYIEQYEPISDNSLTLDLINKIKNEFSHCNVLQFIVTDSPSITNDDWYTIPPSTKIADRSEFQIYNSLLQEFPLCKINFFNQQCLDLEDYDIKWAAPTINRYCRENYSIKPNITQISYKLSCLINRPQLARTIFAALGLNLNCLTTYNSIFKDDSKIVSSAKFTSKKLKNLFNSNFMLACKTYNKNKIFVDGNMKATLQSHKLIQKGFCNVVIEDPVFGDWHLITEKTMKPMSCLRPFILLSTPGALSWLRSQGFKTFSAWWDESYDDITDHYKRIEKVYEIAELINSYSFYDLLEMYKSMQEVLLHNQMFLKIFAEKSVSSLFPG